MTDTPPFAPGDRVRIVTKSGLNTASAPLDLGAIVDVRTVDTSDKTLCVTGAHNVTGAPGVTWINMADAELVPTPAAIVEDTIGISRAWRDLVIQRDADRRDAEIARANPTTPAAPERVRPQGATYDDAALVAAIWGATRAGAAAWSEVPPTFDPALSSGAEVTITAVVFESIKADLENMRRERDEARDELAEAHAAVNALIELNDASEAELRAELADARAYSLRVAAAERRMMWQPISTAPKDRGIAVYCPPAHGLPHLICGCRWHEDAGFCVDELREPTHRAELPA